VEVLDGVQSASFWRFDKGDVNTIEHLMR